MIYISTQTEKNKNIKQGRNDIDDKRKIQKFINKNRDVFDKSVTSLLSENGLSWSKKIQESFITNLIKVVNKQAYLFLVYLRVNKRLKNNKGVFTLFSSQSGHISFVIKPVLSFVGKTPPTFSLELEINLKKQELVILFLQSGIDEGKIIKKKDEIIPLCGYFKGLGVQFDKSKIPDKIISDKHKRIKSENKKIKSEEKNQGDEVKTSEKTTPFKLIGSIISVILIALACGYFFFKKK